MAEPLLTDRDARARIATDLDTNLVVLAGAGAGKTHSLIERMVEVVRRGKAPVDRIAAITFTRKAAGEMRGRFYTGLREAHGAAEHLGERGLLLQGLQRIDQAFIGTIHAFCGKLLRERPLEAMLPPDFTELDEREEEVLRSAAWDQFLHHATESGDPRLGTLLDLKVQGQDLFEFFERRCGFSDLELKPGTPRPVDLQTTVQRIMEFVTQAEAVIPHPLPDRVDKLQAALQHARRITDTTGLRTDIDRIELVRVFEPASLAPTLKCWAPNEDAAREIRDGSLPELRDRVIVPALTLWREAAYPHAVDLVDEAVRSYSEERHRRGTLTFQDLLEEAAALLRGNSGVRRAFQDRYRVLFVDEFQDTDPIQAELLLYLTGEDLEEEDWRKCRPKPGSLFLVGDEKQSIYRFRRADLDVFRQVGDIVKSTGGDILDLTTSFRSLGKVCTWINSAFQPRFEADDRRYQAEFARLERHRPDGVQPHHVWRLSTPRIKKHPRSEITALEAERIANFIQAALAGETPTNSDGSDKESILGAKAAPSDFLILAWNRSQIGTYARALEERRIPFETTGGARLGDALEIAEFVNLLSAVHTPDNPVPLVAYLRGLFVGLRDDELYALRRADEDFRFRYTDRLPKSIPEETRTRVSRAFSRLASAQDALQNNPPSVAFALILEDLGIVPYAAGQEMGSSKAGNLMRMLALVRTWEGGRKTMHWGEVLHELRSMVNDPSYKAEEMTLESGGNAVRLMNLHQAKGLQARVVFLVDPYQRNAGRHEPDFHVSRSSNPPYLSLPVHRATSQYSREMVAAPIDWSADQEEEARFLEAEKLRLLYVAATRAENLLVVSRYEGNPDSGPWSGVNPFLDDVPELPDFPRRELPPPESAVFDPKAETESREAVEQAIRRETYRSGTISVGDDHPRGSVAAVTEDSQPDDTVSSGKDYGTFVHDLLELAVRGLLPDDERAYVENAIGSYQLETASAVDAMEDLAAFRASELWTEIETSDAVHTEVDITHADTDQETPTVTRGRIDLIYNTPSGWKIVDYKTDQAEPADLVAAYGGQIRAYRGYWEEITGASVSEAGLWITRARTFVAV